MELEWIQRCVCENAYLYSRHGDQERRNDGLTLMEVEQAILTGRVLERYDDTGRGLPSGGFHPLGEARACGLRANG